jgi:hypothetical protein
LLSLVPGANAIYLNNSIRSKIMSAMRQLNIAIDRVGDKKEMSYQGVPLLDIGFKGDGSAIIPQTETKGSSSVASSIYAVRYDDAPEGGGVTGLSNGGVQVKDLGEIDAKPVYRTRIEFFCGMGLFSGKAAARLEGVLNS